MISALLSGLEEKVAKNGRPFIVVTVSVKEGVDTFYAWDSLDEVKALTVGKVYDFNVDDGQFKKLLSVPTPSSAKPEDFIISGFGSNEEALEAFSYMLSKITDSELASLNKRLVNDKKLMKLFLEAPAASGHHHNYRQGLLQHTFEVFKFVESFVGNPYFKDVDFNMALEGALWHDIGKVQDYTLSGGVAQYYYGNLVGSHLQFGAELIALYAENPFSPKVEHLKHIIKSHHFRKDWDAISTPKTREALLVFYADYYSMFVYKMTKATQGPAGILTKDRDQFMDFNSFESVLGGDNE